MMVVVLVSGLLVGCAPSATNGAARSLVVLTVDQAAEVVVPAGAFDQSATTTLTTTTAAPITNESAGDGSAEGAETAHKATEALDTDAADDEATASETSMVSTTEAIEVTTTTVAPTSTTVEVVKETIPLEEQKVPPGIKMMDALEEFNGCLADEGVEFIGRPDAAKGPEDPVNQPAYIQALTSCAGKSGIVDAMQEFQASRVGRTPDQIREDNEQFIAMAGCLRSKGWTVSDPVPDENGSLGPGEAFTGPDGDLDMDDIRACISENNLARGEG